MILRLSDDCGREVAMTVPDDLWGSLAYPALPKGLDDADEVSAFVADVDRQSAAMVEIIEKFLTPAVSLLGEKT